MGSEESKETNETKEDETVVHDSVFRPDVCPRYEPGAYDEANESARRRYADEIWHSVASSAVSSPVAGKYTSPKAAALSSRTTPALFLYTSSRPTTHHIDESRFALPESSPRTWCRGVSSARPPVATQEASIYAGLTSGTMRRPAVQVRLEHGRKWS
eukprot:CAMPEP_0198649574 /NCGR_PEP_ID=MMETSP1467-20131203/4365_1 /TAXON_ID=1462469 /ORGANISM="unid. sp., Strain CCMP2135" /LENGTH=156 /DNA_ID=CAMNT_0044385369 /DNA_START=80 /DNA_END=552 /DNA_ORIENTATION=+